MTDLDIVAVFSHCFRQRYATELIGGAAEPLYQPCAHADGMHRLFYRENYAASALHETAHWCIAGVKRRRQLDFGYTYLEPPRTPDLQSTFFASELKVQALEQVFCEAAGLRFVPSADHSGVDLNDFRQHLQQEQEHVRQWMQVSSDQRARQFERALLDMHAQRRSGVG